MHPARLFSAIAVLVLSASAWAQDDPVAWFAGKFGDAALETDGGGYEIHATLTRRSTRDLASVERELAEIQGLPDHPDRIGLEWHQKLLREPGVIPLHFIWSGPDTMYCLEEKGTGSPIDVSTVSDGDVRWRLGADGNRGQLTVIASGRPFPAGYDLNRASNRVKDSAIRMVGGVPWSNPPPTLVENSLENGYWHLRFETTSGSLLDVIGKWHGEMPYIEHVQLSKQTDGTVFWQTSYEGQRFDGTAMGFWPTRIIHEESRSIQEVIEVKSSEIVTPRVVRAAVEIPSDLGDGVQVYDFRSEESSAWDRYRSSPRVTWSRRNGKDEYDMTEVLARWQAATGARQSESTGLSTGARIAAFAASFCVLMLIVWAGIRRIRG